MVINLNIVTAKAREWRDRATPYALWGYGKGAGPREWGIGSRAWGGWRGLVTGWKAWKSKTMGLFRKSGRLRLKPLISAG